MSAAEPVAEASSNIQSDVLTGETAAPVVAERPSWLPEAYWDAEKGEAKGEQFAQELSDLQAAKAKLDERSAAVPESAEGYTIELPEDLSIPAGYRLDLEDPLYLAARQMAHEQGLTQAEFNGLAATYLKAEAAKIAAFQQRISAEKAKLGADADVRVNAVTQALVGRLGDAARPLIAMLVSADHVVALEKLLAGGEVPFSQGGREEGANDGKPSNWSGLSAVDRRTFQIAQQMNNGRRS